MVLSFYAKIYLVLDRDRQFTTIVLQIDKSQTQRDVGQAYSGVIDIGESDIQFRHIRTLRQGNPFSFRAETSCQDSLISPRVLSYRLDIRNIRHGVNLLHKAELYFSISRGQQRFVSIAA